MAYSLDKPQDLAYIKVEDDRFILYYHKVLIERETGREYLGAIHARVVSNSYKHAKQMLQNCLDSYKSKGWT